MNRTVVDTIHSLAGGKYYKLRNAIYNNVKVITRLEDGSALEEQLPMQRQASVFRKDLAELAKRDGNEKMDSCWLQFQCVPTSGPGVHWGYKVSELIEALAHADGFYATCYKLGEKVNLYKATMIDGVPF